MKKILILTAILFVGIMVNAEDLTTKSGKTYKDVKFCLITPSGIDISFKKGDETYLTHVFFADLPEKIQKKFHYSPIKAKKYREQLLKIHEDALKRHAKWAKEQKEKSASMLALESRIEAGSVNVVLKEFSEKPDGTVAWASNPHCSVTTGHFGKIFVAGLLGLSGGETASVVYPTGTNRYGYPCYAITLDKAVEIAQQ